MKEGWRDVCVKDIVELKYGKGLPKSERNPEGAYPVYGANGIMDWSDHKLANGPSIVIGRKGSAGELNRVQGSFWPSDVTYFTSHDPSAVDFSYLYYLLKNLNLPSMAKGVKPGINRNDVYGLKIPLPPLDEQKCIVSILDQAFEGLDRARANAEANLESAKELFEQAVEDGLSSKGDNWISTTIDAVCDSVEYGTSSKSEPEGAVPVLRMGNMQDGEIDWTDLVYSNSPLDIAKYKLKPNDVLFNRTNSLEHVGKTAIYRGETTALFAGYLIRLNYKPDIVNPEYLNFFLNSSNVRQYGRMVSGKSVNQANISGSKLKLYKISLPPLQEQMEIAGRLKDLKRQSNLLRHTYRLKLENVEGLRQSLLQKAFSGELT